MKLFLIFLLMCFGIGVIFEQRNLKPHIVLLLILCTLVCIGYYYFNKA